MEGRNNFGFEAEVEVGEHDVAVLAEEDVFWFEVAVDDPERVEILEGGEDLGGEEPGGFDGEAAVGLFHEEGLEVAVGAVVDEETRVVGDVDAGVKRREERVVEQGEDLGLRLQVGLLLRRDGRMVYNLEGERGVGMIIVAEAAEEDTSEVAGAEVAEELEMSQVESLVG